MTTYRQRRHQDGGIERDHKGHEAEAVSDEAPLLKPIDAGGPIELLSGSVYSSPTKQRQSQTASLTPPLPRKSSRRQRRADAQIGSISCVAPWISVIGWHGQLTPVPSHHFPVSGTAPPGSRQLRPVQSRLHRYYTSTIQPSI